MNACKPIREPLHNAEQAGTFIKKKETQLY